MDKTLKRVYSKFKVMNENKFDPDSLRDDADASSMNTITDDQWNHMIDIVEAMNELLEEKPRYDDLLSLAQELSTLEARVDEAIINIERHS